MSGLNIPLNQDALSALLGDPIMNRLVIVVNTVSLSILELLEYGFTRKDVNRAMAKDVIEFAKSPSLSGFRAVGSRDVVHHIPETGDYYFEVLSSKVRLTRLGLHILEIIGDGERAEPKGDQDLETSPFQRPTPQF